MTKNDEGITPLERLYLHIIRDNRVKGFPNVMEFDRTLLGRRVKFEWRVKNQGWGRFGGGWNWNVGVQAGGSTVIFNLLVATLRVDRKKRTK